MSLLIIALLILYTVALAAYHARQRQGESLLAEIFWAVVTLGMI